MAVGYRKDVFMFFVDRVELSEFLMKSFALLTMKSKPTVLMKISATQKMKLNPPLRGGEILLRNMKYAFSV